MKTCPYCSSVYITDLAQTFSATRLRFQTLKELHEVKYFTRLSKIRQNFKHLHHWSVNYRYWDNIAKQTEKLKKKEEKSAAKPMRNDKFKQKRVIVDSCLSLPNA